MVKKLPTFVVGVCVIHLLTHALENVLQFVQKALDLTSFCVRIEKGIQWILKS